MRLVTFRIGNRPPRPGALVEEGGREALEQAARVLRRPPREALFALEQVSLLAPIPQPPQMRDFLCFEKHLHDFSARNEQTLDMMGQLGPGKGKDFDNANGHSSEMHWKFEDCIAHVSRSETLHPGECFGSGTVGNGCGLEHMKFLKPGDVVELEAERIGVLRNRVVR